jgi:hypothetical protein
MSKSNETHEIPQFDYEQIMAALDAVLASEKFVSAPQMSAFLRYVVEQAASGNKARIKAYTVAIDALGKPETFDPQNDPVVRVLAGRLRASLQAYYDANPEIDFRIQMKPGSYAPVFINRMVGDNDSAVIVEPPAKVSQASSPSPDIHGETEKTPPESHADLTEEPGQGQHLTSQLLPSQHQSHPSAAQSSSLQALTGSLIASALRFPTIGIVLTMLVLGLFAGARYISEGQLLTDPPSTDTPQNATLVQTDRPEKLALFIGTIDSDSMLVNQLNTILSGVFSESGAVKVYRQLDSIAKQRYSPEDYRVALHIMPLPGETRLNIQLVDGETGRVTHSETLALSEKADQHLTTEELNSIMNAARRLIDPDGPLFEDYNRKLKRSDQTAE